MKKVIYLIFAFIAGILFLGFTFVLFAGIWALINKEVDTITGICMILFGAFMCFVFVRITDLLNHRSDGVGGKGLSRWGMNMLFVGFIFMFFLFLLFISIYAEEHPLQATYRKEVVVLGIVAVVVSTVMYIRNYHFLQSRETRIQKLEKSSLISGTNRYHMLVEDVNEDGSVFGNLSGVMKKGDYVHAIAAGDKRLPLVVSAIIKDGQVVTQAKDSEVIVQLKNIPNDIKLEKYTVITNVGPLKENKNEINTENIRVASMVKNYRRHADDNDYGSTLIYDICHGTYLLPTHLADDEKMDGDIMDITRDGKDVNFMSVSTNDLGDAPIFPIFTDWSELKNYKEVIGDDRTLVIKMNFPECIQIARRNYDGIVINPFGDASYYIPNENLTIIQSLEGYKEDFIYNNKE